VELERLGELRSECLVIERRLVHGRHQDEALAVGVEDTAKQLPELIRGEIRRGGVPLVRDLEENLDRLQQPFLDQIDLVLEVDVEGRSRDPGLRGQVADLDIREARSPLELTFQGGEQLLLHLAPAPGAGSIRAARKASHQRPPP
jgi:hypothetical protein